MTNPPTRLGMFGAYASRMPISRACRTVAFFTTAFLASSGAFASEVSFKLEPGLAFALSDPQTDHYALGGGQSFKALFGLNRYLDIGPSFSFMVVPPASGFTVFGTAFTGGFGARIARPRDEVSAMGLSVWADVDALYVRTGALDRPGFDAAVGVSLPIGVTHTFWVGPFVRYLHIFQVYRAGLEQGDANMLTVGLSFEVSTGNGPAREPQQVVAEADPVIQDRVSCPDRDNDTVPDSIDRCPEVKGPLENAGCPNYKKVVVKADKLELKEKLYFAWDRATLEEASFATLDEVAQALKDNPSFRVQVEGHTDSSGTDDHNQTLSEQRAQAVLDYLAAHGVAKDRLTSKGFSSSQPNDTNQTVEGRENNRRVEFVVNFALIKEPAAK
jgi:outer membrane protein OmpA-like peptidoglycan-associated protein